MTEPRVSFEQVYLNPDRRGAAVDAQTKALLAMLSSTRATPDLETLGDALMVVIRGTLTCAEGRR